MLFVTTASETEALLLESNLIKQLKPRYNVSYRDDKSFPQHPAAPGSSLSAIAEASRRQDRQGHLFRALRQRRRGHPHPQHACSAPFCCAPVRIRCSQSRTRPCLLFQIKRCSAPCVGRLDEAAYRELVEEAERFLHGKSRAVQDELVKEMNAASDALDFEARRAAARPAAGDEPHPGQPGHQSFHLRRSRSVRRP